MENYYQILEVPENATQDEIKRAYRKKAVEHHPDKGGSEELFKKIAGAYDVLSDENKRRDYDNKRNNPFSNMSGGFDGFNPFEDFFNNQSFYKQRKRSAPEKVIELSVGVIESYRGVDKNLTYMRKNQCVTCNGSGGEKKMCTICGGQGSVNVKQGTGIFVQITRHVCQSCSGKGNFLINACHSCNGSGSHVSTETINIKLPHGIDEGQMFKIKSVGDWFENGYGDLIVKVKLVPENNFEKNGNDLIYNLYLNYEDLKKESVEIPHPTGNIIINLPNEVDTSRPLRVKSKGFNQSGDGDLFIKQYVKFKRNS